MAADPSSPGCPNLWIVGGGGAALQVWAVARAQGTPGFALRGFVVKVPPRFDVEELAVVEENAFLATADCKRDQIVLAVGAPRRRERLAHKFRAAGLASPVLIHPSAMIGPNVVLGSGCVVMPKAVVETHVLLGEHVLVNLAAVIAHECVVGACTNIGPAACLAGGSHLGRRCDLGAASVLRPQTTLGDDVVVGAGAVVVCDYRSPTTIVGSPAKPLNRRSSSASHRSQRPRCMDDLTL